MEINTTEKSVNQKIMDKILERDKWYWEQKVKNFDKTGNYYEK